jgi:hypothetical protein
MTETDAAKLDHITIHSVVEQVRSNPGLADLIRMAAAFYTAVVAELDKPRPSGPGGGSEPKDKKGEEPTSEAPAQAGTISAVEEQTATAGLIPEDLSIPPFMRHTEEASDAPVPLTPPQPAPAPSPAPSPPTSPSPVRARRRREKHPENEADLIAAGFVKSQQCGVYMRPWPANWERISADSLEVVICNTGAFGVEHGCEEQVRPQLQKMRSRLEVLRKADRAERPQANAEAAHV